MSLDLPAASAILKTRWTSEEIHNVASAAHVAYNKIKHKNDFTGDGKLVIPVEYANPSQIGGQFSLVQGTPGAATDVASTRWAKFELTRRLQYLVPRVHALVDVASSDPAGAFFVAGNNEMKRISEEFGNRMGAHLYRSGTGSLGQIATGGISGNIITLAEPRDARNFKVGMRIVVSATDGGTPRAGETYVTSQQIAAGKFVVNNLADITGAAALDFVAAIGDFPAGGTIGEGAIHGFEAWLPATAPAVGESFFGTDRGKAPELLAGQRVTQVAGQTLVEVVQDLETNIWDAGGKGEAIGLCSPQNLNVMKKQLGSQIQREAGVGGKMGFSYVEHTTDNRTVRWYGDPDCPRKRMYIIDPSTWTLHTAMDFPEWEDFAEGMFRLRDGTDYREGRGRAWGNLACSAPRDNGVAVLL